MLNKIKQLKKNKKGFTLIELVVVLVIIAVLAAITVPVVTGYIEDANNARYVSDARSIYLVIQAEEAKAKAKGETPDYSAIGIVATSNTKLANNTTTIVVSSITPPSTVEPVSTSYTVNFTSDGKGIVATISPNDEITVAKATVTNP